ncbi:MAG TPA: M28 family peptidase [Gemmatimonadaceae bacterium]|nr:M28 family peptidase [Gemmatimonadaceae bacterium]
MPSYRRIPPRRAPSWRRVALTWSALLAAVAAALLLVAWSERLPAPRPATADPGTFSAGRAWPVLTALVDDVGARTAGTPGAERALRDLERRLGALPGWEVTVQDTIGVRLGRSRPFAYRTRNLLARLPGRGPGTVLLSAHYDTPIGSVGAADDGVAAAALVEVARALSEERRRRGSFRNTLVINLNGAEEQGMFGAEGFVLHPWARDVRAFVDLESAGTSGKAVLFQSGPGNHWLARAYARAAPLPYGTVIGQDLFQSGWIPSSTDFEVYARGLGVPGLDMALYRGGWKYHTPLDRTDAIAPGTLQHVGENALALALRLADAELPAGADSARSVYYDVLGLTMVAYDERVAFRLALGVAVLAVLTVLVVIWRHGIPPNHVAVAILLTVVGVALALLLPVALAWLVGGPLGRPHGWFAHPTRGAAAYALLALAGLLLPQWLFARRVRTREIEPAARTAAAAGAALLVGLVPLLVAAWAGVGSGFLLVWTVAGGAIGVLFAGANANRGRPVAALLLAGFPALVLAAQTTFLAVALFAPIAGRFPLPVPFDVVIAALIAAGTVTALLVPVTLAQHATRPGAALATALAVGLVMLAWTAVTFPFTPERPQRIVVTHEASTAGNAALRLTGSDYVGLGAAMRAAAVSDDAPRGAAEGVRLSAPPLLFAGPAARLEGERAVDGGRELALRVPFEGAIRVQLRLDVPHEIVSVEGIPVGRAGPLALVGAPDRGWRVVVRTRDAGPVGVHVSAHYDVTTVAARSLMNRLPPWTAPYAMASTTRLVTF